MSGASPLTNEGLVTYVMGNAGFNARKYLSQLLGGPLQPL